MHVVEASERPANPQRTIMCFALQGHVHLARTLSGLQGLSNGSLLTLCLCCVCDQASAAKMPHLLVTLQFGVSQLSLHAGLTVILSLLGAGLWRHKLCILAG